MATVEFIGARAYEADNRTLEVLREHSPEAAERITATLGDPLPGSHLPEHQLFISEATAALADIVGWQAKLNRSPAKLQRSAAGREKMPSEASGYRPVATSRRSR